MWPKLNEPNLVLPTKHAVLFRDALDYLSDLIGWDDWEDDGFDAGVAVFDRLTPGQKQAVLLEVGRALLQPQSPPPKITACLAGAVAAVYEALLGLIELEIDTRRTKLRRQVLAVLDEMNYWSAVNDGRLPDAEPFQCPRPNCSDLPVWMDIVEDLRTTVLDDYDFDMESTFLDVAPEAAAELKRTMNIDPDYFTDIPEDPTPERLRVVRRELLELTRAESRGDDT